MKRRLVILTIVAAIVLGVVVALRFAKRSDVEKEGFVTYREKSGDFIQFFIRELKHYGGKVTVTGTMPVMPAKWRYAEDDNGFQVLIAQSFRDDFVRSITNSLGEPILSDSYPQLVYKEDRVGVGTVVNLRSDPIHIICIRKGALFR